MKSQRFTWQTQGALLVFFVILILVISGGGYFYFSFEKKQIIIDEKNALGAIADLKTREIAQWRYERLADGEAIMENPILIRRVTEYLKNRDDGARNKDLIDWFNSIRSTMGLEVVFLCDSKGSVRTVVGQPKPILDSLENTLALQALHKPELTLSDLHKTYRLPYATLNLIVPIVQQDDVRKQAIGVLVLRIDPQKVLFPLIQSWPTPSLTSETILLRREGDDVLYLNELRHRKNTALSLRTPVSVENLPAAMAARGIQGTVEGVDYRGVPVLASIVKIPDSPWYLVAKMDQDEMYAPLREKMWMIAIIVALLVSSVGGAFGFWWRHQRALFYRHRYEAELERRALAEHYSYLVKYANDIIILANERREIVAANDRALEAYGYTGEEIIGLNVIELRAPSAVAKFEEQFGPVDDLRGRVYETTHQRKDGTTFPVETSVRLMEIEGKKFYQEIIRDITERQLAEEALRESEHRYRSLFEVNPLMVFELDTEGTVLSVNKAGAEQLGYTADELVGKPVLTVFHEDDKEAIKKQFVAVLRNPKQTYKWELRKVHKQGHIIWVQETANVLSYGGGKTSVLIICEDITNRKQAELLQNAVYRISEATEEAVNLDTLFKSVHEVISTVMAAKNFYISLYDHEKDLISFPYFVDEVDVVPTTRKPRKGLTEYVLRTGRALLCDEATNQRLQKSGEVELVGEPSAIWVGVPLIVRDKVIGVMVAQHYDNPNAYGERELHMLAYVSSQVAKAIESQLARETLRQSEARLKALFAAMTDVIIVLSAEGRFLEIAPTNPSLLYKPANEVLGRTINEVFPADQAEFFLKNVRRTLELQQPTDIEYRLSIREKDVWFAATIAPMSPDSVILVARDITETRLAEQTLRIKDNAVESAINGMAFADLRGRITFANPACLKMWGFDNGQEVQGLPVAGFWAAGEKGIEALKAIRERGSWRGELLAKRKDGSVFDAEVHGTVVLDEKKKPICLMASVVDITERKRAEESLRESEERFRQLANAPLGGIGISERGTIVDANEQLAQMLGYDLTELIGRPALDFVASQSRAAVQDRIQSGNEQAYEHLALRKDGTVFPVEVRARTIHVRGRTLRITSLNDISERINAEEAIRKSEERYRLLFSSINDSVFVHELTDRNLPGKIIEVNDLACERYGYTRSEFLQMTPLDIDTPEGGEMVPSMMRTLQIEKYAVWEGMHVTKDGRKIPVEISNHLFDLEGKRVILATIRDIAERKRAEQQNVLLAQTLKSSRDCISITDLEDNIIFVNDAFLSTYRYTEAELIGKNISFVRPGVITPESVEGVLPSTLQDVWHGELINQRKDGTEFPVELWTSLVKDGSGKPIAAVGVARDISERRQLQLQLFQIQKLESIGTLAGGIAHDFNNILGIILGHLGLLERTRDDQVKFRESVNSVKNAVERGASLVRQILTFARKAATKFEPVNINVAVSEIVKMLGETLPKTMTLVLKLDRAVPYTFMDQTQLHQALLNLCVNARDAMDGKGELKIATSLAKGDDVASRFPEARANHYVRLSVSDTGKGMTYETKNRIFEPFFTTKEEGKGTGLGLAVVYGVIQSHGGFVDVESKPGHGTTFHLYFPVPEGIIVEDRKAEESLEDIPGGTETVLVVEDEIVLRELLSTALQQHGYHVLNARDGEEAVKVFTENQKDIALVFSDLGLPKRNGWDALRMMREQKPGILALLASGFIEPALKTEILRSGVKEFIQKPYRFEEVLKTIRKMIDGNG